MLELLLNEDIYGFISIFAIFSFLLLPQDSIFNVWQGFKLTRQSLWKYAPSWQGVSANRQPGQFMSMHQSLGIQLAQLGRDASAAVSISPSAFCTIGRGFSWFMMNLCFPGSGTSRWYSKETCRNRISRNYWKSWAERCGEEVLPTRGNAVSLSYKCKYIIIADHKNFVPYLFLRVCPAERGGVDHVAYIEQSFCLTLLESFCTNIICNKVNFLSLAVSR